MAAPQDSSTKPPFTPRFVEALKPREGDFEVSDAGAPGLVLRVSTTGAKTFRWYANTPGRARERVTIGRFSPRERPGFVTLADARKWLERLKEGYRTGKLDALKLELAAARPANASHPMPVAPGEGGPLLKDVAKDFLEHIGRRRKRPEEVQRTLEKELLPALGERPIRTITSRDVRLVVEAVVKRGSPTQAGKVLAHAKQLFRFATGRDEVAAAANPAYPLEADALGVEHNVCQRFLSAEEIPLFWRALDKARLSPTVKVALKIVMLTGVRTCEILRAKWADLDLDAGTWVIPIANQKLTRKQEQTARDWTVPLTASVVNLFRELEVLAQGSVHVLASPFDPEAVLSEKALVAGMRKLFVAPEGKPPPLTLPDPRPTPHDLRRSVRTHLGDSLGISWHIAERCLNHSIGRVTQTYDVGDYLAERRAALEKWSAYVARLIEGKKAPVAFLPKAGRVS